MSPPSGPIYVDIPARGGSANPQCVCKHNNSGEGIKIMKTLKQALLASAGVVVMTGSVYAADLPLKAAGPMLLPVSNWTGPYIGAHVGAASYQSTCAVAGPSESGYACPGNEGPDPGRDIS